MNKWYYLVFLGFAIGGCRLYGATGIGWEGYLYFLLIVLGILYRRSGKPREQPRQ